MPAALKVPTSSQAQLGADIEKRDAVVAAFRVCRPTEFNVPYSPTVLACVFCIRYVECHVIPCITPKRDFHLSERDAFGADEYHPLTHKGSNLTAAGGIGYTIADSLDTIILMQQQGYDFDAEYDRARTWIQDTLSFDRDANFNTFEVRLVSIKTTRYSFQYRQQSESLGVFFRHTI